MVALVGIIPFASTASAAEDPIRTTASSSYTAVPSKGRVNATVT